MSLTRRRFIEAASLTLLASSAPAVAFAQSVSGLKQGTFSAEEVAVLDDISEETFAPLIGESFAVSQGNRRLEPLTLLSVTSAAKPNPPSTLSKARNTLKPPEQTVNCFSLRFKSSGESLTQGTYTLTNASLGSFPLFIVPGSRETSPHSYTATFNRLAP
jgi:hypothetical protein